MDIALTWNLALLCILLVIFTFSFLLGQRATIKLILSIYIAILTADGVAEFIRKMVIENLPGLQSLLANFESEMFMGLRIGIFILAIMVFVIKGSFHVQLDDHDHWAARSAIHGMFSIMASILFVATILIYLSGNSFVEGILYASQINIYQESFIAQLLIDYYQFWFSLPAIGFLITSFFFDPEE